MLTSPIKFFIPDPPFKIRQEPRHLIWHITNRCPLQCVYCFTDSKPDEELEKKDIGLSIARRIAEAKPERVSVIGGEPLLVEWLPEALQIIRKYSPTTKINLDSNLVLLTEERYSQLRGLVDEWNTTVDSHISFIHNRTRGSWNKTIENVRFLVSRGETVRVVIVVTRNNIDHVRETVEFIKSMGAEPIISKGKPLGRGRWSPIILSREEIIERSDYLRSLQCKKVGFTYPGLGFGGAPSCYCGVYRFTINWRGELFPCELMIKERGVSIVDKPIRDAIKEWEWWAKIVLLYPAVCEECPYSDRCTKSCRYATMLSSGNPLAKPINCDLHDNSIYEVIGYESFSPIFEEGRKRWESNTGMILAKLWKEGKLKEPIFELGCGGGVWLAFFEEKLGVPIEGCDINKSMLQLWELYRQKKGLRSRAYLGDALMINKKGTLLMLDNFITHFDMEDLKKLFSKGEILVIELDEREVPSKPLHMEYIFAGRKISEVVIPKGGRKVEKILNNGYASVRIIQYLYKVTEITDVLTDIGFDTETYHYGRNDRALIYASFTS